MSQNQRGKTLLTYLKELLPDSSMTTLRSLLLSKRVIVNGKKAKSIHLPLTSKDKVTLLPQIKKVLQRIPILYQDKHFIAIDKPSGLLSVATHFEKKQTAHALLKKEFYPKKIYVVHRLDQETSGVLLFAFTKKGYDLIKNIFYTHSIDRRYLAIIEGKMRKKEGTFRSYLYEDQNYVVHTTKNPKQGELAITHFKVIKTKNTYTLLELMLETGKKNQIRVHLKEAGHPVVGDKKYGAKTNPTNRLCLHAKHLSFIHPISKKRVEISSAIPKSFSKAL